MEGHTPAATNRPLFTGRLMLAAVLASPSLALAQIDAEGKVCGFLDSIGGILSAASIAVVTIAIIFAGYQIAFAHKRISDVAPILIGGLLIGAAGQIARMVIGPGAAECTAMIAAAAPVFHA